MCQLITITNANAIHASASASASRDRMMNSSLAAPPTPHHAANTNINCHANGLKYQVVPGGYEARLRSNQRAAIYSTTEAASVRFGRRIRHHRISGEASTSVI